ncbi:MAG: ABC transporter ATP-binding protein, partial [Thermotogaceae bacterium]|nr:ABC transporter ATP-binding protein [Thermotogaceae bacterium]
MLRVIKNVLWVLQMSPKWVRRYFYLYSFVCFLNDFAFAALPFIFKTIVDELSRGNDVWPNVRLYILVTIFAYISIRSFSAFNIVVSSRVMKLWKDKVFSSILRMKHNLWKEKGAGYWQNVLSEDVDMLLDAYHDFVYTIPAEIAVVIFMTAVVFYFCNLSGFILLITLLLSVWEVHLKEKKVIASYYALSESKRELQDKVLMVFHGVEGLRHFAPCSNLTKIVSESTNKFKENLKDYSKRALIVEGWLHSMVEVLKIVAIS